MKSIRAAMYGNMMVALDAFQKLSRERMQAAETWIKEIISLKYQMESLADQKGYSRACRDSIPSCRGECCKWHYPRNLTRLDFCMAIFHMTEDRQAALAQLILINSHRYCPILLDTGCFLSFEERPVLCTNAYPCFIDRSYWIEKEKKNILFNKAFASLDRVIAFE